MLLVEDLELVRKHNVRGGETFSKSLIIAVSGTIMVITECFEYSCQFGFLLLKSPLSS